LAGAPDAAAALSAASAFPVSPFLRVVGTASSASTAPAASDENPISQPISALSHVRSAAAARPDVVVQRPTVGAAIKATAASGRCAADIDVQLLSLRDRNNRKHTTAAAAGRSGTCGSASNDRNLRHERRYDKCLLLTRVKKCTMV
jgi:hypothetical protein